MSEAKGETKPLWRTATDPKSGREYYYNSVTKETTWTKPDALLTPTELEEVIRKRDETRNFFADMEQNILSKIRGEERPEPSQPEGERRDSDDGFHNGRPRRSSVGGIRLVRTISTIDDELLEMMKHGVSTSQEESSMYMPDPFGSSVGFRERADSLGRGREDKDEKDCKSSRPLSPEQVKAPREIKARSARQIRRRNSTGTIYIDSTLSKQDDEHTMDCIGVVIRAHMLDAEGQTVVPRKEYEAFEDVGPADAKGRGSNRKIPSLDTVTKFFKMVFEKCQIEKECIIITLVYIERLVKATKGRLAIRPSNWRSILFACMVMASKVWDDLSMWNVDFSQVSEEFDLHRVNELELALLSALEYSVKVPASEYAKYYFHLRSMMARLGFHKNSNSMLMPLDIRGAKKLELATAEYENNQQQEQGSRRRGASVIASGPGYIRPSTLSRMHSTPEGGDHPHDYHESVGLEQLVHGVHLNADGSIPQAKRTPNSKAEAKR